MNYPRRFRYLRKSFISFHVVPEHSNLRDGVVTQPLWNRYLPIVIRFSLGFRAGDVLIIAIFPVIIYICNYAAAC